jgi:hypothetical protein
LFKQALQIDRSACTSGRDYEFHFWLSVISSEATNALTEPTRPKSLF